MENQQELSVEGSVKSLITPNNYISGSSLKIPQFQAKCQFHS